MDSPAVWRLISALGPNQQSLTVVEQPETLQNLFVRVVRVPLLAYHDVQKFIESDEPVTSIANWGTRILAEEKEKLKSEWIVSSARLHLLTLSVWR